jgi:hypothetical protein
MMSGLKENSEKKSAMPTGGMMRETVNYGLPLGFGQITKNAIYCKQAQNKQDLFRIWVEIGVQWPKL